MQFLRDFTLVLLSFSGRGVAGFHGFATLQIYYFSRFGRIYSKVTSLSGCFYGSLGMEYVHKILDLQVICRTASLSFNFKRLSA